MQDYPFTCTRVKTFAIRNCWHRDGSVSLFCDNIGQYFGRFVAKAAAVSHFRTRLRTEGQAFVCLTQKIPFAMHDLR